MTTTDTGKFYKTRLLWIAGALVCIFVPLLMKLSNPNIATAQSLCPFKLLTGLPCPGCGIAKSFIAVFEGNLPLSLHYHLFGPLLFFSCVFALCLNSAELIARRNLMSRHWLYNRTAAWICAGAFGLFHLVRIVLFISQHSFSQILKESIWA